MKTIRQAVIFAGGLGTRLRPFTENNPKPMYSFKGKPFLSYLIEQVRDWGIKDIIILLGYLPEKIMGYFKDGAKLGVSIRYVVTPVEYDTQYRLKAARGLLADDFLMMYCDNLCPIDYPKLVSEYEQNDALIQVTAYANKDGYTKDNMCIRDDGLVEIYDKKRQAEGLKGVDIGYAVVSKDVFDFMSEENENFEAVVYPKLVKEGRLYALVTEHRYYSIGSFDRIGLTEKFLSGQKYIFIDRDGVLNQCPPKGEYVCRPEEFIWLAGAKEAVKRLNEAGYFIIMVSNQAGIARRMMSENDFEKIQDKMKADLEELGAHIDAVYYCPHGWEDGCECRKPKPGMLYQAQKEYSINLTECVLIGDDERDIWAAKHANMKGILVTETYPLGKAVDDFLSGNAVYYEVTE
ncbi:HAD-IIIA family hydrolase [Selenomonas ruminantium]|uniref:D,D-heptose 1,7-bisphosphate phosphatase n=1 Tax=Selenomonas ruminantium TaxID=971 RepID=A0A1H4A9K8_SELRU|nr:HAD-IIIA family hydrolase [Selenomonas ruminantium]SEA32626.1 D-glycero-D-manno-heptose 1,7-bisphosphate phosphatase [Selenomonas ruminantium]